ncbi:MAG: ribonuclease III [bacterium]|nr:ribonuclease III [bacterium]
MISQERIEQLNEFLASVNLKCNTENLNIALTHSSYCNENNLPFELCNERLEFLGDAVLKLIISNYLYSRFPSYKEGDLSQIRSTVVSDETLYKISEKINLKKYILLGTAEDSNGGRNRHSTIACAFEALLGALYLDGRLSETTDFLQNLFEEEITIVDQEGLKGNTKALLQEYYQAFSNNVPEYVLTKQEGPPHNRTFYVDVFFENEYLASGVGTTKKAAQKEAALKACELLGLLNGEKHE